MISDKAKIAFCVDGDGILLEGGQRNSYRFNSIVIKPYDGNDNNYGHICNILKKINSDKYRISQPVISKNGRYIEDGFIAFVYEEGNHDFSKVLETLELCKVFHKDLRQLNITNLPEANDPWSKALDVLLRDKELPDELKIREYKLNLELLSNLPKLDAKHQLIHSDFGGNVLFHNSLTPFIIDFSPNIAPPMLPEAITICDAIAWSGIKLSTITMLKPMKEYQPYIKYAIAFRVLAIAFNKDYNIDRFLEEWNAYKPIWNYIKGV